jgi:serine/threonine-protein kinase
MADVYRARDIRLGREVAIKLLRRDLARDPTFQTRFRREAQAVAGLNHPSIVAVYDTGDEEVEDAAEHEVRVPYIVMEIVQGRTLRDLLTAGELTVESAVRYTLGVLAALDYSHRKGIVHRDIKPSNVMVTADDQVKVMDFGIARALADSAATMTQTQAVVGTAQYLSPEQARGEVVDARSDLYSAGCLLFELLTDRPPFTGDSPVSVAFQHVSGEAPAPSELNPAVNHQLDTVVSTALAKGREDRYQDAVVFAAALQAALEGRSVPADRGDATVALSVMPASTQAMATSPEPTRALRAGQPTSYPREGGTPAEAGQGGAPVDAGQDVARHDAREPASGAGLQETAAYPAHRADPVPDDDGHPDRGEQSPVGLPLYGDYPEARAIGHEELERYRTSRRRAWITVFSIATVLVLAAGAWFLWTWGQQEKARNATVAVPTVANMSLTDAQNQLLAANLIPRTEEVYDDTVDKGLVVGTNPSGGEQARVETEVVLRVSLGPEQVVLPKDLAGQSEATVRSTLEDLGLQVGKDIVKENSAVVGMGSLITTNPKLGEKVKTGSVVELTLSTGKVTVPSLMDLDVDKARDVLADDAIGLNLAVQEEANTVLKPGTITRQVPAAGTDIEQGGTVTITVAKAPEETTPSPTPPADGSTPPQESGSPTESPEPSAEPGEKGKGQDNGNGKGNGNGNGNGNGQGNGNRKG